MLSSLASAAHFKNVKTATENASITCIYLPLETNKTTTPKNNNISRQFMYIMLIYKTHILGLSAAVPRNLLNIVVLFPVFHVDVLFRLLAGARFFCRLSNH